MNTQTITHFCNGIGNFVLFTPALRALASMDPSGQVDLCTDTTWVDYRKSELCDLLDKLPFIQNVYPVSDSFQKRYKTWFWSEWSTHGNARELFNAMQPHQEEYWDHNKVHESDYYFNIVQKFYGFKEWKPTQMIIPDTTGPKLNISLKNIVICNGGYGEHKSLKQWEHFKQLVKTIRQFYGDDIVVSKVGFGEELSDVECINDFVGNLSISKTAYVIKQADLFITNDTGNMHIADALGTPMIVLWGGTVLEKNCPIHAMNKIIHIGHKCQPCLQTGEYRNCAQRKCLNDITVGEIMFYIRKFFSEGKLNG